jgi:hypothetical protein
VHEQQEAATMRWRVLHTFDGGAKVLVPVEAYPGLGITFRYDDTGSLVSLTHEFDADDALHAPDVIRASNERLRSLWAALEFLRRSPLPQRTASAHRVLPLGARRGEVSLYAAAEIKVKGQAVLQIAMPSEAAVIAADPRLLEIANAARAEEDPADALQDFYTVLEGVMGRGDVPREIKHARDFVSHGEPLKNLELLEFVKAEIGEPADGYDPGNPKHVEFVKRWRLHASGLVQQKLGDWLR